VPSQASSRPRNGHLAGTPSDHVEQQSLCFLLISFWTASDLDTRPIGTVVRSDQGNGTVSLESDSVACTFSKASLIFCTRANEVPAFQVFQSCNLSGPNPMMFVNLSGTMLVRSEWLRRWSRFAADMGQAPWSDCCSSEARAAAGPQVLCLWSCLGSIPALPGSPALLSF
jgi:hypothetical protein